MPETELRYKLVPIMDVKVGDRLPSWSGEVVVIRDTPKRRYFTVKCGDGTTFTDYQANYTQIVMEDR